jgi:hypothetical protein
MNGERATSHITLKPVAFGCKTIETLEQDGNIVKITAIYIEECTFADAIGNFIAHSISIAGETTFLVSRGKKRSH